MKRNFPIRCALQLIASLLLAVQAHGASILFDDNNGTGQTGTLSYDGTLGDPLVGAGIDFVTIKGVGTPSNNGASLTCEGCKLNFTTGGSLDEEIPGFPADAWVFDGGGTFTITGTAKDSSNTVIASGILVSGFWGGAVALRPSTQLDTLGFGSDTKNSGLLTFFGITNPNFSFSQSNLGQLTSFNNSTKAFTAKVMNADFQNDTPVPEPNSPLLFGLGFLAMGLLRQRRMKTV
jgi:hypothetical protein